MFARFGTLLLILIEAVLLFSVPVDAINVDYVGPSSGSLNYCFTGNTHYGQAHFDEPYDTVYWYMKGPGETGLGTIADVDYGDGTSTVSYFDHTFDGGSTIGEKYEITAYVYSAGGEVDWDSYTVTIWTPPEKVITVSDEPQISDDIKVGDYYTFSFDAMSSSSNYVIDEIEVFVDGVSFGKQSYSAETSVTRLVSGFLPTSAGSTMSVEAHLRVSLLKRIGEKLGVYILTETWDALLRGNIQVECFCLTDLDRLDNDTMPYTCYNPSPTKHSFTDSTGVHWYIKNGPKDEKGSDHTMNPDTKKFTLFGVPFGWDITLKVNSTDLHKHGPDNPEFYTICEYEHEKEVGKVGTVKFGIPTSWGDIDTSILAPPKSTKDPCENKGTQKNPND